MRFYNCKMSYVFEDEALWRTKNNNEFEYWKRIIKMSYDLEASVKKLKPWLKCFTVCVANDLKHSMAETYFGRRKSKTRVFWLLFCSLPWKVYEFNIHKIIKTMNKKVIERISHSFLSWHKNEPKKSSLCLQVGQ